MTDTEKPKKKGRKKQNSSISLPHGRKRTISPGFFTDAALLGLPPLHRLFFEGLFCWMDREGRVLYRPIDLKVRILPMDPFDPVQGLADLEAAGLIRIHETRGLKVISVKPRPWREVQRLHPDEPESALPPHPEDSPEPDPVSDDENDAPDPIPVHGNEPGAPISGPGSSGSSCLRDPRAFVPAGSAGSSGSPPLPPSSEGGSKERSCTCTRRPCRHERQLRVVPEAPPLPEWDRTTPAGQAWAARLDNLRRAGAAYAVSQLERLTPHAIVDGRLVVRAADPFFGDWVREHYVATGLLERGNTGPPIALEYAAKEGATA